VTAHRIDSHVHVVGADQSRFPLAPTGLGRPWWTEPGRDADALLSVARLNGVGRAVLVQPVGAYAYDNSYLLHAAARHSPRFAAVPAIDLDGQSCEHVQATIKRLAEVPQVVGVRFFAVSPGSEWTSDPARAGAAFNAAGEAGLVIVLTVFAHQLGYLTHLITGSATAVAIDHCGFPQLRTGRLPDDAPLLALRGSNRVVLKVSTHLLHDAAAHGDPAQLMDQLAQEFGPHRLLWGSDYPQTGADYPALVETAERATQSLTSAEREAFFGANAARVFSRPGLW
jgi:predicted TIM-barrel fold metal-dependent hydrolase